ncbi:MAG TPA: hypothetical protein VKB35_15465 [Ktedonobacteraceae bacterium]|nr:hypothetical protein [Ktedonobacteraceae bacterium]
MTNTERVISRLQVAAIILMAAGFGWAGGNFTPSDAPFWNPLLHTIPIVLILIFGLPMLRMRGTHQYIESHAGWANVGMSVFAVIAIAFVIVAVVLGATNPNPNAFGVKTVEDWFPAVIIIVGSLLWLRTLIPASLRNAEARAASSS